jgi:hypothetical protein
MLDLRDVRGGNWIALKGSRFRPMSLQFQDKTRLSPLAGDVNLTAQELARFLD